MTHPTAICANVSVTIQLTPTNLMWI